MTHLQNISLPGPTITPITKPFWEHLKKGVIMLQRCNTCEEWIFYPRAHCPHCFSESLRWEQASGRGVLKTWSIVHRPGNAAWKPLAPYVVGVVELKEGPSMLSHILTDHSNLAYQQEVEIDLITAGNQPLPFFKVCEEELN
ncbi:hypothetical protein EQV77_06465 [Halobacillus fulvus]|nr:hypothetical protein EQV77_06465 [Halobacillus fulvus]